MRLFKNVDIIDLKAIVSEGILPIEETGNCNWDYGKRVNNATDVVYLFNTIEGGRNSFVNYGSALIEVEVEDAVENELEDYDVNKGNYTEYICKSVAPENILAIHIPEMFKKNIKDEYIEGIEIDWCGIDFEIYKEEGFVKATEDDYKFFEDMPVSKASSYGYLRGIDERRYVVDMENVNYIF